jgi:hypothetical protein
MEQPSATPQSSRGASIAELATEAEKVAEVSVAAPIVEHDLEPPDWLSETPPTADVAEAAPEPEPPPTPEPERESPTPEPEPEEPLAPEPAEVPEGSASARSASSGCGSWASR